MAGPTTTKATAPTSKATAATRRSSSAKSQIRHVSTQARFATSKLIQNLGSSNPGIQFNFVSDLRTAHGRD